MSSIRLAPELAEFAQALRDPARPLPPGLDAPEPATLPRRFAVHRNTYLLTLVAALAESFPVVHALVGKDFFQALAREYVRAEPPRSPILLEHGRGFAGFVAGFAPAATVPYLADIARLEWLRLWSFHAADADVADPSGLAALAAMPDRLAATRVRLHPSAHWLHARHAAHSLWQAHQLPAGARDMALAELDPHRPEDVLVLREGTTVAAHRLPPGGLAWLNALATGATLGDALDTAAHETPAATADTLLQLLLHLPLVTHFLIPD